MKKYFMLFLLSLAFGVVKAQVKPTYDEVDFNHYANFTPDDETQGEMSYTDNNSSGEITHTDGFGNTYDVTWAIVDSTLSWEVNVSAAAGAYLHLHRLLITDDPFSTTSIVDDDFEDGDGLGFGSDYWHSSGSANLGNVQHTLYFSFENMTTDVNGDYQTDQDFIAHIYYREPL